MRTHKTRPQIFPQTWASSWGEDEYGLWMAFTYKSVEQRFRWIEPGTFKMGSPVDEKGRNSDEIQHPVTLRQGYWLAETTVTQALWKVVMGANPSHFTGENRPVEKVSWNDVQEFIQTVNQLKSELLLCLPTEAQWEYACRAGTLTRFSFGDEINQQQVNFSSSQTEIVQTYPCNDWGLFDMHGNVWEWCQDVYGHYTSEPIVDPQIREGSSIRVLRGGSWFYSGRYARSAYRRWSELGHRLGRPGFRLALGHELQSDRQESKEHSI